MKVQPAKRFPYSKITGFCVNKYTDLVKVGDAFASGRQTKIVVCVESLQLSTELRQKRSRYLTSSGFLSNSSGFG